VGLWAAALTFFLLFYSTVQSASAYMNIAFLAINSCHSNLRC
jgi:hypothetical protein